MRSDAIVIVGVGFQNLVQMHLAQDNDVVYTLTPDRSDQPFGKAVLPGRGWCGRLVPDAHGAQSACDEIPERRSCGSDQNNGQPIKRQQKKPPTECSVPWLDDCGYLERRYQMMS